MSTLMLLYIRHDSQDALPCDVVARDYFGLSGPEFRKRALKLGFPSSPGPSGDRNWTISLMELANYIDQRRAAANRAMQGYYRESAGCSPDEAGICPKHYFRS